jgi:condensin complex subunit 2
MGIDESVITAKQRKEKVAFSIDFSLPPLISQKELFAAGLATSINAPRKSTAAPTAKSRRSSRPQAAKEDTHVLPDDFHFSSQLLLRLFLKPKTAVRPYNRLPRPGRY